MLDTLPAVRQFVLERMQFYMDQHLAFPAPSFRNNMQTAVEVDRMCNAVVLHFQTLAVKGDTINEAKRVEYQYEFNVFRTWWDHLKYDLMKGRVFGWMPVSWQKWWGRRIQYQKIVKKKTEDVPVTVTRCCPHADVRWEHGLHVHVAWLKGVDLRAYKRP